MFANFNFILFIRKDHARVLRQVTNFQRKLDEMNAKDPEVSVEIAIDAAIDGATVILMC